MAYSKIKLKTAENHINNSVILKPKVRGIMNILLFISIHVGVRIGLFLSPIIISQYPL